MKSPIDGLKRIVEMMRLAILFVKVAVNDGEVVLGDGPLEWHALAGQFLAGFAMGFDGLCEPPAPLSRLPSSLSAVPRLFWVVAHSSGTRARVNSCKASR